MWAGLSGSRMESLQSVGHDILIDRFWNMIIENLKPFERQYCETTATGTLQKIKLEIGGVDSQTR